MQINPEYLQKRPTCHEHKQPLTECFALHHPELEEFKKNSVNNDPEFRRLLAEEIHIQKQQENEAKQKDSTGPSVNGKKEST